jgi:hypothetical protein
MEIHDDAAPVTGDGDSAEAQSAVPQLTNLDSLSEFEFQGEKFTPERFQEIYKGFQTLSEQQKSVQSEDRYWRNLEADLDNVRQNQSLADAFKRTYPAKFHAVLGAIVRGETPGADQNQSQLPKEFLNEFGQLKSSYGQLQNQLHQMAVDSANAKLDAILPKLYDKFPMAVEDQVLARAEAILTNGGKLTEATWERLAKESHEAVQKKADGFYKKQLNAQTEKGLMGKDIGSGGAVPGKAPQKIRTFADAEREMMAHVRANNITF